MDEPFGARGSTRATTRRARELRRWRARAARRRGLAPRDAHETADLGRAPRASRRSAVGRRCRAARSWRGRWTSGRASRGRVCCPHTAVNGRRRAAS